VDRVRTLVCSVRRLGVRLVAEEFNMSREIVRQVIMYEKNFRKDGTSNLDG
jgi:hypothetical protein